MLISAALLGEAVPVKAWVFALAVLAVVVLGQRLARASPAPAASHSPAMPPVRHLETSPT